MAETISDNDTTSIIITRQTMNAAMILLARRPDLAIGMTISLGMSRNIQMNILRNGAMFVIDVDERGVCRLIGNPDDKGFRILASDTSPTIELTQRISEYIDRPLSWISAIKKGRVSRAITPGDRFMAKAKLPLPFPGILAKGGGKFDGNMVASSAGHHYMPRVASPYDGYSLLGYGITKTALPKPGAHSIEAIRSFHERGGNILIGRVDEETDLVALHHVDDLPKIHRQNIQIFSGCSLEDILR